MTLKCLGTGSSGNCYSLTDKEGNILLLDAGINVKDIKIGIDFQIAKVKGALITHKHLDHAMAARDLEKMGIKIIAPYISKPDPYLGGGFMVTYFPLTDNTGKFVHSNGDSSECPVYGYLIEHDSEPLRMLYITDCEFVKWRFYKIDTVLIGIDYMDKYLENEQNEIKKRHVLSGHMSLNTGKEFIKITDRDKTLKNVIIGHLSESNSDYQIFENEISKVTDANVNVARKGVIYELS